MKMLNNRAHWTTRSGLTKINEISLTAQTVPDIFISEDSA